MRISTPQLHLLIQVIKVEVKKNPSTEIDALLALFVKQLEHRVETYKGGVSFDPNLTLTELKKLKAKRERKLRPKLEDTDWHPIMGNRKKD